MFASVLLSIGAHRHGFWIVWAPRKNSCRDGWTTQQLRVLVFLPEDLCLVSGTLQATPNRPPVILALGNPAALASAAPVLTRNTPQHTCTHMCVVRNKIDLFEQLY